MNLISKKKCVYKIKTAFLKYKNNDDIKEGLKNSMYLYLAQGLNYILPFLILPYLLRILSVDSFGIYVYSLMFSQVGMLFVDFGFNINISKKITTLPVDSSEVVDLFWLIILIQFLICGVIFIIVLLLLNTIAYLHPYRYGIILSMISLIGFVLFPTWIFQGLNKMKQLGFISAISKIITFPFIFVFVSRSTDYDKALIIQSLSWIVAGIFSTVYILKDKRFRKVNRHIIKWKKIFSELSQSFLILISNSAVTITTSSITFLLGMFTSTYFVGVYGAIERIVRAIYSSIYLPLNQAFYPIIARMSVQYPDKAKRMFKGVFFLVCAIMGTIIILFFFIGEKFILQYCFKGYTNIKFLLEISIGVVLPISLGGICGQLGLIAIGSEKHKRIFSKVYIFICLLTLPLSLIAIYFFKLNGAIFSMLFSQIMVFILMFFYVKKYKIF